MAGQPGTAVVVDVDSGRLLAGYRLDVGARTLASPGSTLKPFALVALLESGKVTPETALVCKRRVRIGGQSLDCTHVETVEPLDTPGLIDHPVFLQVGRDRLFFM